jgi:Holliday junction resolvase-like predicted endonuclease
VKFKSSRAWGDPVEMVTPEKIRRIRRAAEVWLTVNPRYRGYAVRFDIVAVLGRELRCLQGAF